MLTSLYQAVITHLAGLEAPVYHADCVPADAPFSYVVMEIDAPLTPARKGQFSLTAWAFGDGAHGQRLQLAESLLTRIPARGLYLALAEGAVTLRMDASAGAESLHRGKALGLRMTWALEYYPNSKGGSA